MKFSLIISGIGVVTTIIGTTIALIELCRANKTRRAEFVHKIWSDIVYNRDMMDVLYQIDYGMKIFTKLFFNHY